MARLFQDQIAFITGASSGIGAAVAEEFARQGANVVLFARRADRLADVKAAVEAHGVEALVIEGDVRNRDALDAAAEKTVSTFGRIDVGFANAGFGVTGPFQRCETEDWRRQFETNVFGVLDTMYALLPHLAETNGRLGVVGSIMGRVGMPGSAAYCGSKFAVNGIAEAAYYDLADLGVSLTCINPGIVESEIRSVNNQGEYTGKPDKAPAWIVMPKEKAARQIVHALYARKPEFVVTFHGKAVVFLARHFPWLLRMVFRFKPKRARKPRTAT